MTPGTDLPLYTLDDLHRVKWTDTGITASVDAGGVTASAQVTHFSTYSVMPEIEVTETFDDTLWEGGEKRFNQRGSVPVVYENRFNALESRYIHFDSDTTGLNVSTLIYMFEQFHGVSFTKPVTETVYYVAPRWDMYAYKIIRVLSLSEQMKLVQPDRIVDVRKHIKRPIIEWLSHDQGGGG